VCSPDLFGSGTSSKSSKLIHGGIRYLEIAWASLLRGRLREAWQNYRFVFSALKECRRLEKIAPNLVTPLALLIPIYRSDPRRKWTVFAGAYLYFLLALFSGETRMPKIYASKRRILSKLPSLNPDGLLGGIRIWDRLVDDTALVQATIASACRCGARCYERTQVMNYKKLNDSIYEIEVRDPQGVVHRIRSRSLVNASGPWVDTVQKLGGEFIRNFIAPIAGSHITLKRFLPYSVILQARDHRIFFCINIKDHVRIGTTEWRCDDPDNVIVPEKDIHYFIEALAFYFPEHKITVADIVSKDAGIRPLYRSSKATSPNAISREHEILESDAGVLHVAGVKLTDHRRAAEDVVDVLVKKLNTQEFKPCRTHQEKL
jgi:glycerol-3-phosphate dehydrogenase